ncbi:HPr-rel-A system PqqD family peptide chaperone [Pseudoduganella violaceinigra]|uniref:HPr-rel-A system PqqD family peptide chaperone n=1 Tax=Pseudoduganella violaceinigra TaxID=246602 RepID=UPI0004281E5A|nr:HPr-rel-A system PqqD family peptide chaperone [Pseudoduganella violaceinigra]
MTAPAWRILPGQSLRHRSWDGQAVLYNDVSGSTHLLDQATLDLLHALRDGDITPDELADPDLAPALAALQKLYLVEAC